MSKLTGYDKATIKEWYASQQYTQQELAAIYGVGRSTIQRVLHEPDFTQEISDGHDDPMDGHENAHPSEPVGTDAQDDSPPWWLGWGLVAVTLGMAGFVGWLVYNAY